MNILKYLLIQNKLDKLFIIFDIDGILLRYKHEQDKYEFSPIILHLFNFINKYNIKWGIATHGTTFNILKTNISPIYNSFTKLNPNYIKCLISNKYDINDHKCHMLTDLINQSITDYDINSVIFFDDDINNINQFNQLVNKYPNINLKSFNILPNDDDKCNNEIYPLIRLSSFNTDTLNFNNIFTNILST